MREPLLMTAYPCPRCGEPGIGLLRRLFLGSKLPATCGACGGKVGVSSESQLGLALPSLLAGLTLLGWLALGLVVQPEAPGLLIPTETAFLLTGLVSAWALLGLASLRAPLVPR